MAIHRFEVGQKLLCFEPDSSKAKVIYLAKVLKHVNKKSDVPYYAVHFQGWKCKWDREVPEHLLLENTEFNRMLKRRIDDIAHNVRCRLKRKQRIDQVLELAAASGESVNWDQIPGSRRQDPGHIRTCSQKAATKTSLNSSLPTKVDTERTEEFEAISLDEEDPVQSQYENLQVHHLFTAPVELPGKLRSVLNSHGLGTTSSGTGSWCSVLQLLQSYVDGFPYAHSVAVLTHLQVSCSERAARVLGPAYLRTDQNRILCADVCSSLRILFDTTLESGLHPIEQQTSGRPRTEFYNNGRAFSPTAHSPPTVQSVYRYTSPRYELLPDPEAEKAPNLPCLNCPAHDILRLFVNLPRILEGLSMTLCRRAIVSRHLAMFLDYLERTSTYWFTEMCPVEFETKLSVRNAVPTASTGHIKSRLTTAQSTSETSSSTEPLVQISEPSHRTTRTNRRDILTSSSIPSLRGANPKASVSNEHQAKTEEDLVQPTSPQSSHPNTSNSTPVRSAGLPPASNVSKHLRLFEARQCLHRQNLRSPQSVSSSELQIQPDVSSVHTNKSMRSSILSKTQTQPSRCSTRLTERPLTTEGRVLRPRS